MDTSFVQVTWGFIRKIKPEKHGPCHEDADGHFSKTEILRGWCWTPNTLWQFSAMKGKGRVKVIRESPSLEMPGWPLGGGVRWLRCPLREESLECGGSSQGRRVWDGGVERHRTWVAAERDTWLCWVMTQLVQEQGQATQGSLGNIMGDDSGRCRADHALRAIMQSNSTIRFAF